MTKPEFNSTEEEVLEQVMAWRTEDRRLRGLDVSDPSLYSVHNVPITEQEGDRYKRETVAEKDRGIKVANDEHARLTGVATHKYQAKIKALDSLYRKVGRRSFNRAGLR
jgi:hypothetical protein